MRDNFKGWDPRLTKLISLITSALKWPLLSGSKLTQWVHPSKRLLIMGDAAHTMLPYMSEGRDTYYSRVVFLAYSHIGASIAVKDGAALAEAIHYAKNKAHIPDALAVWEAVRIERSS